MILNYENDNRHTPPVLLSARVDLHGAHTIHAPPSRNLDLSSSMIGEVIGLPGGELNMPMFLKFKGGSGEEKNVMFRTFERRGVKNYDGHITLPVGDYLVETIGVILNWSGQGKKDTKLSYPRTFFVLIRTDIPEIRILPPAVIEHLDVSDDVVFGFLTCGVITVRRPFPLSTTEKSRGNGMVKTVPLAPHTANDPMLRQQLSIRLAGILTAAGRMVPQSGCGHTRCLWHL